MQERSKPVGPTIVAPVENDRHETPSERYDRNWSELLQELRVAQTGIQLLAGFLLTLPFSQRFTSISGAERILFLLAFGLAVLSTCLLITPVACHRILFGLHEKEVLVRVGNKVTRVGMVTLGLTLVVVATLIFSVVLTAAAGIIAGVVLFALILSVWWLLPMQLRR